MNIRLYVKDTQELYITPLLQQTAYWSEVKSIMGFVPLAYEIVVREKDIHPHLRTSAFISDDPKTTAKVEPYSTSYFSS